MQDNSLAVGREKLFTGSLKCSAGAMRLIVTFRNYILWYLVNSGAYLVTPRNQAMALMTAGSDPSLKPGQFPYVAR